MTKYDGCGLYLYFTPRVKMICCSIVRQLTRAAARFFPHEQVRPLATLQAYFHKLFYPISANEMEEPRMDWHHEATSGIHNLWTCVGIRAF